LGSGCGRKKWHEGSVMENIADSMEIKKKCWKI